MHIYNSVCTIAVPILSTLELYKDTNLQTMLSPKQFKHYSE